jgi:hypothetical protein
VFAKRVSSCALFHPYIWFSPIFFFCEPLDIFLTLTHPSANKTFCLPSCICLHCLLPTEESVAALECGKTHVLHKHCRAAGGLVRWMGLMGAQIQHKDTHSAHRDSFCSLPTFHWRALQPHSGCKRDGKYFCTS